MAIVVKKFLSGTISAAGNSLTSTAVGTGKVQVVEEIRIVNKHATATATITITAGGIVAGPSSLVLGPGQQLIDEGQIVLNASESLVVTHVGGSGGGPIDVIASGFERDQS